MASITKRKDSYFVAVSCGYDQNGRQIRRTMTYKPEANMTERQIQKEVQRQAVLFEEQVRNGQVSSDGRLKLADFVPSISRPPSNVCRPMFTSATRILSISALFRRSGI